MIMIYLLLSSLLFVLPIANAVPDPILITKSAGMDKVVFDGKWTTSLEWKPTSWNELKYNETRIELRTAHQGDFVYVFLDAINDQTLDSKNDKATICFDAKNNKSNTPDKDDFCFVAILGLNEGSTYQGGLGSESTSNFEKILNPEGFIAISSISDENNRYSDIPHIGYEFRIPTGLVGRSDNYGFYVSVYDASVQRFYVWPTALQNENFTDIPSPAVWGDLISPDKSLPEFELPLLVLLPSIILLIYLNRFRMYHER